VAAWSPRAVSYESYNPGNANDGCFQGHGGFEGGFSAPLHQLHSSDMTDNCLVCHKQTGDNPKLKESGADSNHGFNGCHSGVGLRAHHANAGAPADGAGRLCAACHENDPSPPSEAVARAYYGRTDVFVSNPCLLDPAEDGQDFDNDGKGLDNDGDLAYDAADSDCSGVPVEASTWGTIKAFYR
jgi:hypothetical protein